MITVPSLPTAEAKSRRLAGHDRWSDLTCLAIFGAAAMIFIGPAVWSGDPLGAYPSDGTRLHYFVREYLLRSIGEGRLPLWNPYTQFGAPFLANMQWGVFYPLNFALLRLSPALAYNLFIAIHLALAGAFMYLLARDWRLDRVPALVAGFSFMFSGRLISMAWGGGLNHLSALAWLPLVVLCFNRAARAGSLSAGAIWAGACSAIWAVQILSGHPQYSYLSAIVMLVMAGWNAAEKRGAARFVPLGTWMAIVFAGLALSALQLYPTYEATAMSTRSFAWQVTQSPTSFEGSYNPIRLVTWLMPDIFGNSVSLRPASTDWLSLVLKEPHSDEFRGYIGVLPLVLALLTVPDCRRDRRVAMLWSIVVGGLLLAVGDLTPAYGFLYKIAPPFRVFRIPARFLNVVLFAAALLAGIGAQRVLDVHRPISRIWTRGLALVAVFVAIAVAVGLGVRTEVLAYGRHLALPLFAVRPSGFGLAATARDTLIARAYALSLRSGLTSAVFLAATAAIFWLAAAQTRRLFLGAVVALVTVVDLGLQARMYVSAEPISVHSSGNAALVALLRRAPDQYRTYTFAPPDPALLPDPIRPSDNVFMHEHLLTGGGYDSFELQTYRAVRDLLDTDLKNGSSFVASLFGLRYIVSTKPLEIPGLRRAGDVGTAAIYDNATSLPRFYIVGRATRIPDAVTALARVRNHDLRAGDEVLVESAEAVPLSSAGPAGRAVVVVSEPEEIHIDVHASRDGYLVANDSFYPGWTATVDGQAASILRANGAVRAVAVRAGDHRLTMTFAPVSDAGWRISAISAAALTLLVAGLLTTRARHVRTQAARPANEVNV